MEKKEEKFLKTNTNWHAVMGADDPGSSPPTYATMPYMDGVAEPMVIHFVNLPTHRISRWLRRIALRR